MKKYWKHYVVLLGIAVSGLSFSGKFTTPLHFDVPKDWPKPRYDFAKNPLTEEGFQLGRQLFYDPILSRDNTISCASCHLQATGFTHIDHDVSHGIDGRLGTRNSLVLVNLAWNANFMWDGGVNNLEVQAINPITNPLEMDETLENVVGKLQRSEKYESLFTKAFGDKKVTSQRLLKALAQFTVMLKSSNSRYDKVMRGEDSFTAQEKNGLALFMHNCASCHPAPLFTNNALENNGLKPDDFFRDGGRIKITGSINDSLKFKVPTLRNIEFSAPYMHDGRFRTLTEVIRHYNSGIHQSATLPARLQTPMRLSDNERVDLLVFLKTLTDKDFLYDKRFSYPKE